MSTAVTADEKDDFKIDEDLPKQTIILGTQGWLDEQWG